MMQVKNCLGIMEESSFNPRVGKRVFGVIACAIAGVLGGVVGSIFAWLLGAYALTGILGQSEPGFLFPILSEGWYFGIVGIIPGLLIGLTYGITNNYKFWIAAVIFVFVSCCGSEFLFGYPTTIPAIFYYFGSPIFIVLCSAWASSRLKIRLGLMPPEQAEGFEEADDEIFRF